ncbi:hypothetical protein E8E13_011590 [Curvularia kusanoi]|uniref:C6 transcription factor n=1 Tax=Curvularia kusanoi TaxID=90978 RepID=A0A9P4TQ91_CURKU|nr:hypothetical protein E8E13_011590 [Curvularia kusanoi]
MPLCQLLSIWHQSSLADRIIQIKNFLVYEMPSEPHTYASVGPVSRVLDAPHLTPYFRTWLFFQITHSGVHCCINHPFIIFIKARQNKSRIPLTFLQKAHKDSLIYASWVAKSLSDMENTDLDVLDPFLAFLVGIAASIHLEHSLSTNNSIASSATQKLETCRTYLVSVARIWPKVEKRIVALDALRSRVGGRSALHYVEDEYDGAVPVRSMRHVSLSAIDEQLMWTLFDSSHEPSPNSSGPVNRSSGLGAEEFDHPFNDPVPQSRTEDAAIQSEPTLGLPPDIDLTVDWSDWSLLGLPWLAYFPSDAACL